MLVGGGRDENSPVMLIDITAYGWDDALTQLSVGQYTAQVKAGTFRFTWH